MEVRMKSGEVQLKDLPFRLVACENYVVHQPLGYRSPYIWDSISRQSVRNVTTFRLRRNTKVDIRINWPLQSVWGNYKNVGVALTGRMPVGPKKLVLEDENSAQLAALKSFLIFSDLESSQRGSLLTGVIHPESGGPNGSGTVALESMSECDYAEANWYRKYGMIPVNRPYVGGEISVEIVD
jgi:hypothetical protein